jgi:RimJ/RimL family protein N-acetyltransferase
MRPVELSSPLLRLDQLRDDDIPRVFEYCQDPVMPQYLAALPWPYGQDDATDFVTGYVPAAWAGDREYTWAVRGSAAPGLLGVISLSVPGAAGEPRADPAGRAGSMGFWLGAPHRGQGLMVEAERLVLDWAFDTGICDAVHWECVTGNLASARAARKAGFRYTGQEPAGVAYRDGTHPLSWKGVLGALDDRTPRAGWPAEVMGA